MSKHNKKELNNGKKKKKNKSSNSMPPRKVWRLDYLPKKDSET